MKPIRKTTMILTLALIFVLGAFGTWAASPEIDMTIPDNPVPYNDALFIQGPIDINSAGTGVLNPFLSTDGGGNQAITMAYNTVDSSAEYDTITGGDRTRPLLLSGVPEVEIGGVFYREFKLDINKAKGGNPYLALSQLKLFLTDDPAITGYDYTGGTEFGSDATKVWDLGSAVVLMDYSLESGSGQSDVSFFVKSSVFATTEDCSYGSAECTTWLVMWNEFGNLVESTKYPDPTWENNDGFEEWSIVLRPVVDAEKSADGTYDETHSWEVEKTVYPSSQSAFAGDSVDFDWTIMVTENIVSGNVAASGLISITNPTGCGDTTCPIPDDVPAIILSVADVIDQGGVPTDAVVDCGDTFPITLGGGETLICSYTASPSDPVAGFNTATIVVEVPEQIGGGTDTYQATADLTFTANVINGSATLDDDRFPYSDEPVSDGWTNTYTDPDGYTCSSNPEDYTNGENLDNQVSNTAIVYSDGGEEDRSTATTEIDCYLWEVSKTANGSYNDRYDWEITKTVDPESQSGFAGDTLEWEWSITWSSIYVEELNHSVSGVITVDNPAPLELTVDVSDELTGGLAATVECNDADGGTSLTIPANSSGTCDYSASPSSQLAQNTATATRNAVSVSDTVDINWVQGGDVGLDATISDSNHVVIPVDSEQPFTYTDSHTCSTDSGAYDENGNYSGSADNTAEITWTGGSDSDSAHTDYDCYLWDVSKTANGTYDDKWEWDINKTVDPESQSGFAGDTLEWEWTITWSSAFVEEVDHAVSGVITVDNPAPLELTVDVTDELTGGLAATVECNDTDGGTSLTIPANSSGTCDYSATPSSQLAQNTATATRNAVSVSDTVDINWVQGGDVGLDATISDSNHYDIPIDSPQPYTYTDSHTCSDESIYGADGKYSGSADNTATITWTGGSDSDSAHTDYDCYVPSIEKTAVPSFTRTWIWTIDKVADHGYEPPLTGEEAPLMLNYLGDPIVVLYQLTVDATPVDSDYAVDGVITVNNPNPEDTLVVPLTDWLDDETPGVIDQSTCAFDGTYLTVQPDSSEECSYHAADAGSEVTKNTAQIVLNDIKFKARALVSFDVPTTVVDECVDVYDDKTDPDNPVWLGKVCAGDTPAQFGYTLTFGYQGADINVECGYTEYPNVAFLVKEGADITDPNLIVLDQDDWIILIDMVCEQGCTLTQGYWKTHADPLKPKKFDDTWMMEDFDNDGTMEGPDEDFFDTEKTWLVIFNTPPKDGNAYIILAHQYMAAYLNMLSGAMSTPEVDAAMTQAYTLLDTYDGAMDIAKDNPDRATAIGLASTLDDYNNGIIGPGHCDDLEDTAAYSIGGFFSELLP